MKYLLTPFYYTRYLWLKYIKYRKTFGPWMRWSLDKETKEAFLRNGMGEPIYGVSIITTKKQD